MMQRPRWPRNASSSDAHAVDRRPAATASASSIRAVSGPRDLDVADTVGLRDRRHVTRLDLEDVVVGEVEVGVAHADGRRRAGRAERHPSRVMDDAEAAGRAIEAGSNFFLFFSSRPDTTSMPDMGMMARP